MIKFFSLDNTLMDFINSFDDHKEYWNLVLESENPFIIPLPNSIEISEF